MQDTVTAAASMTFVGPFDTAVEGSLVRNGWTAAGAWVGIQSADWAEAGITGGIDTPYDVFVKNLGTRALPEALTQGLGTVWSVTSGYHKIYACCNYAHAAVEASLDLRKRMAPHAPCDIEEILVEAGPGGVALTTVQPATVLAAKFSMPHAVAATTLMGSGGAAAFTFNTLQDDAIAALRRRVKLAAFPDVGPPPRDRPGRVTWTFRDGTAMTATVENPRGGADQPFDEPTLLAKLAENVGSIFPAAPAVLAAIIAGDQGALSSVRLAGDGCSDDAGCEGRMSLLVRSSRRCTPTQRNRCPTRSPRRLRCISSMRWAWVSVAAGSPVGAPYREVGRQLAQGGAATVFGLGVGAAPADAALVNGGLMHSLEFDDTHTGSIMHGSSVIAAAALACAEAHASTGTALLGAYTRGWEVLARFGLAAPGASTRAAFRPPQWPAQSQRRWFRRRACQTVRGSDRRRGRHRAEPGGWRDGVPALLVGEVAAPRMGRSRRRARGAFARAGA